MNDLIMLLLCFRTKMSDVYAPLSHDNLIVESPNSESGGLADKCDAETAHYLNSIQNKAISTYKKVL